MGSFIGTSGYSYRHWQEGVFYPLQWPKNKLLEYYCRHFNSVELNVTFYRLPNQSVFKNWYRKTPKSFRFVIKGSRFITHIKKLKETRNSLEMFFEAACNLKDKLICVLWQLPPSLKADLDKLQNFTKEIKQNKIAKKILHSIEFRHESWFNDQTYEIMKKNNLNLCIADSPSWPCKEVITSDFLYLRFHGGRILYGSEYSEEELQLWSRKAKEWTKTIPILFAFFNNDGYGFAVKNAQRFQSLANE